MHNDFKQSYVTQVCLVALSMKPESSNTTVVLKPCLQGILYKQASRIPLSTTPKSINTTVCGEDSEAKETTKQMATKQHPSQIIRPLCRGVNQCKTRRATTAPESNITIAVPRCSSVHKQSIHLIYKKLYFKKKMQKNKSDFHIFTCFRVILGSIHYIS